ncbi:MAG: DUF5658 family protein [Rhodospirillales bacterium]|nr:DUF5658 family protein [Rhodospirillales bacterium]
MTFSGPFSRLFRLGHRLYDDQPVMLFPDAYCWFILVASMDVMLTWLVLSLGGTEVNPIADRILATTGHWGMVGFKLGITLLVIELCQIVGDRDKRKGSRLAWTAVGISAIPIVWSLGLLLSTSLQYLLIAKQWV